MVTNYVVLFRQMYEIINERVTGEMDDCRNKGKSNSVQSMNALKISEIEISVHINNVHIFEVLVDTNHYWGPSKHSQEKRNAWEFLPHYIKGFWCSIGWIISQEDKNSWQITISKSSNLLSSSVMWNNWCHRYAHEPYPYEWIRHAAFDLQRSCSLLKLAFPDSNHFWISTYKSLTFSDNKCNNCDVKMNKRSQLHCFYIIRIHTKHTSQIEQLTAQMLQIFAWKSSLFILFKYKFW